VSNLKQLILIRCDGGYVVGMGHVMRMLYLAEELLKLGVSTVFYGAYESSVSTLIKERGHQVVSTQVENTLDIFNLVGLLSPMAVIFDVRDNTAPSLLERLRKIGVQTITYDDISERSFEADLAIFHPIPQLKTMHEKKFYGEVIMGPDWVLVDSALSNLKVEYKNKAPIKKIFLSLGGADPGQLTLPLAIAISKAGFKMVVGLGRANPNYDHIKAELLKLGVEVAVDHFSEILECEIAVVAFGTIAWEIATLGRPSILICATEDHFQSAETLVNNNVSVRHISDSEIVKKVLQDLYAFFEGRLNFSNNFPFDGLAAKRLAKKLLGM
jgi:spore coat polysaccharide biosynthesis predicted glycosyltransferase SpsG